jgi:hypothetical protein
MTLIRVFITQGVAKGGVGTIELYPICRPHRVLPVWSPLLDYLIFFTLIEVHARDPHPEVDKLMVSSSAVEIRRTA